MSGTPQQIIVASHIADLEAEAAAERLATAAQGAQTGTSLRRALGLWLIAIGAAIAPSAADDPCADAATPQQA